MRKLPGLLLLVCVLSVSVTAQTLSGGAKISQGAKIQRVASGCGTTAPCNSILDDFDRANDLTPPLSDSWSEPLRVGHSPGWYIDSNVAITTATASTWWLTSFNANQEVFFTPTASVTFAELVMNITSPGTSSYGSVSIYYSGTQWEWYEYTNNTATGICTPISFTYTAGDSFWWRRDGTTLTFARKAAAGSYADLGTCTESAHNNAGFIGLVWYTGANFDNFGGGNR